MIYFNNCFLRILLQELESISGTTRSLGFLFLEAYMSWVKSIRTIDIIQNRWTLPEHSQIMLITFAIYNNPAKYIATLGCSLQNSGLNGKWLRISVLFTAKYQSSSSANIPVPIYFTIWPHFPSLAITPSRWYHQTRPSVHLHPAWWYQIQPVWKPRVFENVIQPKPRNNTTTLLPILLPNLTSFPAIPNHESDIHGLRTRWYHGG